MSSTATKSKSFFWSKIVEIYQQVFNVFQKDPIVWILFVILAIIDFLALTAVFLSHSPPFSYILEPIIRRFTSPIYLHYPHNFILLPKLYAAAHFVVTTFIGVIISGLVIKKIEADVSQGQTVSVIKAGGAVFQKYFGLVIAWLISYGLFTAAFQFLLPFFAINMWTYLAGAFAIALVIQSLVLFLIPSVLISEEGFFKRIGQGFMMGFKQAPISLAMIAIPMIFVVAMSFLKSMSPQYVEFFPELVFIVLAISVIVMAAVDLFVTSSATVLYLKARNKK